MSYIIFVVKESRHGEMRVSLIPPDVATLVNSGCEVVVESQAGIHAGYCNIDYEKAGATIFRIEEQSLESYREAYKKVDIIVRAKRPNEMREKLEVLAIRRGTKMVGSLDLLERHSEHVKEYCAAGIEYYSFDQFDFSPGSPMDSLKEMSTFAGKLAVEDAISRISYTPKKAMIAGYGKAGQAAHTTCIQKNLSCLIITSQSAKVSPINLLGSNVVLLKRELPLAIKQKKIKKHLSDIDIVITTVSQNSEVAPILITEQTFLVMKPGAVIVDLAVPDGGNVVGSQSDQCLIVKNDILVVNVSGYPKYYPVEASKIWSKACSYFVKFLIDSPELLMNLRRKIPNEN